jgi:hypothetical protein
MSPAVSPRSPPIFLDLANECLRCGMQAIALRPKTFAVLCCLVEHAGELVPTAALFDAVWPATVVSDNVLMVCIRELRQASDYATLDLMAALARRQEPEPLLLLGTYRPPDVSLQDHPCTCQHSIERLLILLRQRTSERHPPAPLLLDHLTKGYYPGTYGALSARTESLREKNVAEYINELLI